MTTPVFCLLMLLWIVLLYEDHRLFREYQAADEFIGVLLTQIFGVVIIMTMVFTVSGFYGHHHVGH